MGQFKLGRSIRSLGPQSYGFESPRHILATHAEFKKPQHLLEAVLGSLWKTVELFLKIAIPEKATGSQGGEWILDHPCIQW